jgi:tRNA-dihydrouridine synthase C
MAETGAFLFGVSEFLRVAQEVPPARLFFKHVPELCHGSRTPSGMQVQVQLLGGDPDRMAEAAAIACDCGALSIDINFGCPAPTVNRHDGGATLLKHPSRIRDIVAAVRSATPANLPVSAKLRLGWDTLDAIHENADMAVEGGASWLTIHGRTRIQRYEPPAHWEPIGLVRERVGIPVVANGDIWNIEEFRRCREVTGCSHFMLGRCAVADPTLPAQIASELGLAANHPWIDEAGNSDWKRLLAKLEWYSNVYEQMSPTHLLCRLKQWLSMASRFGSFRGFDAVKRAISVEELFAGLE